MLFLRAPHKRYPQLKQDSGAQNYKNIYDIPNVPLPNVFLWGRSQNEVQMKCLPPGLLLYQLVVTKTLKERR